MTLLSACLSLSAQTVGNPVANPDGTYTFRLEAPQAQNVVISGTVFPETYFDAPSDVWVETKEAQMTKGEDGVWSWKSSVLVPDMYLYYFQVDGVPVCDPKNFQQVRDTDEWRNYFIVTRQKNDFGDMILSHEGPKGNVNHAWYQSKSAGMSRRLSIYTPAGYESSNKKYPVLYLLHGSGNDEEAWADQARAIQTFDNLIAQGKCVPMIVVMPNGHLQRDAMPGKNTVLLDKPVCEMEDHFPDIQNYVESNYRVKKDKASRAICGLSMGGGHSFRTSLKYPENFDYIGLFSASVRVKDYSDPAFEKSVQELFNAKPKLYLIAIGKNDFLYDINLLYRNYLDSKNYPYIYWEKGGGHTWRTWTHYLPEFCEQLFK